MHDIMTAGTETIPLGWKGSYYANIQKYVVGQPVRLEVCSAYKAHECLLHALAWRTEVLHLTRAHGRYLLLNAGVYLVVDVHPVEKLSSDDGMYRVTLLSGSGELYYRFMTGWALNGSNVVKDNP